MISHLKSLDLPTDECRDMLWEAISSNHRFLMLVATTLKVFGQWICGNGMSLHTLSRSCHHSDGLVKFIGRVDEMSKHIVGIKKPPPKEPVANLNEGLCWMLIT